MLVAQGSHHTWTGTVLNGIGAPADPESLQLQIANPESVVVVTAHLADMTRVSTGVYTYSWALDVDQEEGTYSGFWAGILDGAPVAPPYPDTVEVVSAGAIVNGNDLDFIDPTTDWDGIRNLLGVTKADVGDEELASAPFAQQAELRIKNQVKNWAVQIIDPAKRYVLRLAAMYGTAAEWAESRAKGGTVGEVYPTIPIRDWNAASMALWARYTEWVDVGSESDTTVDPLGGAEYGFRLMRMAGPTRARYRVLQITKPNWWKYPPVIGAPPDWPTQLVDFSFDPLGGAEGWQGLV